MGLEVGAEVGKAVGNVVGNAVGKAVGADVGEGVGQACSSDLHRPPCGSDLSPEVAEPGSFTAVL